VSQDLESVVQVIAHAILENEQYFTELDGVVGDGDFGYSLARVLTRSLAGGTTSIGARPAPS